MPKRYRVKRDYRAFYGEEWIQLAKGKTVELDEAVAEWVNRDSPGTLVEVKSRRRAQKPAQDRQQRLVDDRGPQIPMTRENFGAVKDKDN